jgi:hypothetical protein
MVIARLINEKNIECLYSSSNIVASDYNVETKDLKITFKRGLQYTYSGVVSTDYKLFETAESQGNILNTVIKKYPFTKGITVECDALTERIMYEAHARIDAYNNSGTTETKIIE